MDAVTARQNLEAEIRRLTALGRSGVLDPADHGDAGEEGADLYEREVDRALDAEVLAELRALEEALTRVDADTYGRCEACGADIADARLEAVPATRFCVDHEAAAETHLGALHPDDGHDPEQWVRREAQVHFGASDGDPEDADEATVGAEDEAVHIRR